MMRWVMMGLLCGMIMCVPACVWGDPGGQVGRGLGQEKTYAWSETGAFSVAGKGPQTERFTMAEGDIVMAKDDDGNDVIDWDKSRVRYYLRADPSADAARDSMATALEMSTRQAEMIQRSFDNLIGSVLPLIVSRSSPPPNDTDRNPMATVETLLEVVEQIQRLRADASTQPGP